MIEFVIGGARSGKSRYAEQLAAAWCAEAAGRRVVYVATAEPGDEEMAQRIAHHQARRPADWGLIETPLALADALRGAARPDTLLLVDCLTLWLSNLLFSRAAGEPADDLAPIDRRRLDAEQQALCELLPELPGALVLVSNELGWGVVPMGALSRYFVDEQGRLNQRIAALADRVTLVAAGLPLRLKGKP
jgi:adenosylcobinamide kinase / adenosylcobinamide-phosphate guanylyltransferase